MVKRRLTTAFSLLLTLSAINPATAQKKSGNSSASASKPTIKFLDAIEVSTSSDPGEPITTISYSEPVALMEQPTNADLYSYNMVETASPVQFKYAVLLDIEVEQIQNTFVFTTIDEWYGTRYALGGSTKDGIDCSAFIQVLYAKLFQTIMPRTAKEQYKATSHLSQNELEQGDLVFFNTRGSGVSHVGMYLQNNKFVHAATSGGVMVSDLSEDYWAKHYLGAGRSEKQMASKSVAGKP